MLTKVFNGITIGFNQDQQQVNLTNLWKAAGGQRNQDPYHWSVLPESTKFIDTVSQSLNCGKSTVLQTTRGRTGGTWAHRQIALAYAKYLSPELHMFVNECFFERLEEENNPELAISRGRQRAIKTYQRKGHSDLWIEQRVKSIESTLHLNGVIGVYSDDARAFPKCANAINLNILGTTAKKYKENAGLSRNATLRDTFDEITLTAIDLINLLAARKIQEESASGNSECVQAVSEVSHKVSAVIH